MSEPLLIAEKLSRVLPGEVPVSLVKEASLTVNRGEFVVITGPSGSGKSSLLYLLGLLDRPSSGRILLRSQDLSAASDSRLADIRLEEIGFVFQFHFLLPEFSALENVMLPMLRLRKVPDQEARRRAKDLLESLGLGEQIHKLPKQLSGGQSQRVAIARCLANNPELILADEPTGNLDTAASKNVEGILKTLAHEQKKTVVVVTHETRLAENADRVITIVDGRIVN